MYENPFDRKFGIEFEFNCPAISNMRQRNIYGAVESKRETFENLLVDNGLGDFYVGSDGSEFEIKTPILAGPTGFKRVKRFLDLVNDLGARTFLESDGLHVHHDAPEFVNEAGSYNEAPVKALVENWYNVQEQIFQLVNSRRKNGWACPSWNRDDVELLKNQFERYATTFGRKNLNIAALRRHGTIEIRLHEGTLNYEEVLSWVRFGQAFIGKAVDETDAYVTADSPIELMRNIKVSRNASRFLSRKIETVRFA